MSEWHIVVGDVTTRIAADAFVLDAPIGAVGLASATLLGDPPRPEELTNAIGAMIDHLDDVVRERPDAIGADVRLSGADVLAIAAVEVGHEASLPIELTRDAVEDVFRTLATERSADRRHNPGLPADRVQSVVGASCIVVAIMRRLHLDTITITSAVVSA